YTTEPPRTEPFVILGPPGVVQLLRRLAEGYGEWLLDPGFPIGILDVRDGEPFPLNADVSLETFPVPHTDESVALSLVAPEGRHARRSGQGHLRHRGDGLSGAAHAGDAAHRRRAHRQRRPRRCVPARRPTRRSRDHPRLAAVQASQPGVESGTDRRPPAGWRGVRQYGSGGDRRSLLRRN